MSKDYKDFSKEIKKEVAILLCSYSPRELEDCLFDIFNEAVKEPGLVKSEIEQRCYLHSVLRKCLRLLDENKEFSQKLLNYRP